MYQHCLLNKTITVKSNQCLSHLSFGNLVECAVPSKITAHSCFACFKLGEWLIKVGKIGSLVWTVGTPLRPLVCSIRVHAQVWFQIWTTCSPGFKSHESTHIHLHTSQFNTQWDYPEGHLFKKQLHTPKPFRVSVVTLLKNHGTLPTLNNKGVLMDQCWGQGLLKSTAQGKCREKSHDQHECGDWQHFSGCGRQAMCPRVWTYWDTMPYKIPKGETELLHTNWTEQGELHGYTS